MIKRSPFKKIFICLVVLVLAWTSLQFEFTQKALLKVVIKIFTPYKASALEIGKSKKFPFEANIKKVSLTKNNIPIAVLNDVSWKISNLSFKNILLHVNNCSITTEKKSLNFDFSSLSPSVLGHILQQTSHHLQRFESITIDHLEIDKKDLVLQLKRQGQEYIATFSNAIDSLTLTLTPFQNYSKLNLYGFWQGYKLSITSTVHDDIIDFFAQVNILSATDKTIYNFFGNEISFTGCLKKLNQWHLQPLKIETSKGHIINGECAQIGNNLQGIFVYSMPLANSSQLAKCNITVEGTSTSPTIKWEFLEGIKPLEKVFGECTIIDPDHIKLSAQLHHDEKNTASMKLDVSLNPFLIDGDAAIIVEDFQQFLHIFWPNAKGKLNFKAKLDKVSSLEKGVIEIDGQGSIHDKDFHIPLDVAININNGLGEGSLHLTKGHYQHHPLDAHIDFKSTSSEIYIEKCKLQLRDLQLSLLKPTTYHFQNGLTHTQMQFCEGTINIAQLKLENANTTGTINWANIQLRGLKFLFDLENITGSLNGQLQKLQGKPATLKINLSEGFWQKHHDKQTYKILNDLHAILDAEFENSIWKWNLKVKDQDKINIETYGHANFHDSTIDAQIKGITRLKFLTDWLATDDRIFGDVSLQMHLKGSLNSPVLEGSVNLDNGLYEHSEVGTFYQNITVRTKAQGKRLIITRFDAQDVTKSTTPEQGQLRGEGWVDFSDLFSPVFHIPMHLFHLSIAQNDGFIGNASGTLIITGKGSEVGCKGEVTLENVKYFLEQSIDVKVPKVIDRSLKKTKEKKLKEYATAFPLDILVHNPPGSFKVIGLGADTSWQGDFYVRKSIVNPFLVGSVNLHEGTLDVLGKVLRITHGVITFVDDDRNNPRLDIRAIKKLDAGIIVAVEIRGTGNDTIIDFTSTPSMAREEVLALLLFGKKLGEVSVLQSIQLAELAKSEDSGSGFFEKMRSSFGFDQFEFKTTTRGGAAETDEDATPEERAAGKTSQAVRIGKEFGKVQVAIEQGAGSETSKITVSTPLGNNLALQGDVGGAQNSGVGVSWIKRY